MYFREMDDAWCLRRVILPKSQRVAGSLRRDEWLCGGGWMQGIHEMRMATLTPSITFWDFFWERDSSIRYLFTSPGTLLSARQPYSLPSASPGDPFGHYPRLTCLFHFFGTLL